MTHSAYHDQRLRAEPKRMHAARAPDARPTLIIGGGPVGIRAAQALHRAGGSAIVLSDETVPPYNRVQLTPLLGGDAQFSEIVFQNLPEPSNTFQVMLGQRAMRIDPVDRLVITADGAAWPYDTLILATGSRAFIPNIPGRDLAGVYRFRSADDASSLLARSFSARRVAVIGGGLLGLEAARGMARRGCAVSIIEHESRLMPRQLDETGGAILAEHIEDLGVQVHTGVAVKEICGPDRVTGLSLSNGTEIACDTVVICTGIRANVDLAREAGLAYNRGIRVDAQMRTSDPNIFAVGECAEWDGAVYGLVGPGFAQAEVAADVILGKETRFAEPQPATKLKVIGADVFSAGAVELLEDKRNVKSHVWEKDGTYRRIFIERGQLVGALSVGAWETASRVQDAVTHGATIYSWMLFRFRQTGDLFVPGDMSADAMPDDATLCNCTGVTCGQVRRAAEQGASGVGEISAETAAGSVCGTCRPLIEEIVAAGGPPEPIPLWKPLLALSTIGVLAALIPFVFGSVPFPNSYSPDSLRDWLWRDNIVKQWSGFVLLGLMVAAFTISLRKRIRWTDRLGDFNAWRVVHNGLGLATLAGFVAHTGFRLGAGWNLALGLTFIGTILIGAVAGLATGGDHELRARQIGTARQPVRRWPTWMHILLLWPLPILVLAHVLASYAF